MKALYCIFMLMLCHASLADSDSKMYLAANGYLYEEEDSKAKTCTFKSARVSTKDKNDSAKIYDLSFVYKKNKGFFKSNSLTIQIDANIASRLDPSLNHFAITELQLEIPKKTSHKASVSFDKETKKGLTSPISDKKYLKALQEAMALNVEFTYGDLDAKKEKHKESAQLLADDIAALKALIKLCEKKES